MSKGVKACSKRNCVFPGQGHMFLSPDSPRQKPGRAPLPGWRCSCPLGQSGSLGQQARSSCPRKRWLPGSSSPSPVPSQSTLFLEVNETGPQCLLCPSRMPVAGSYPPQEGLVLLADRISVPAQLFPYCVIWGKLLDLSRGSTSHTENGDPRNTEGTECSNVSKTSVTATWHLQHSKKMGGCDYYHCPATLILFRAVKDLE